MTYLPDLTPDQFNADIETPSPSVFISEENCEALTSIPDNHFDHIIGNLVIHLTPDPEIMVSEVHRILKPGGTAAFSVLWNFDECTFFSLKQNLYVSRYSMDDQEFRSMFHLDSTDSLKKLFSKFQVLGFHSHIQDFQIYEDLYKVSFL